MYQQDIYVWNNDKMVDKMKDMEFQFEILPSNKNGEMVSLTHFDKP